MSETAKNLIALIKMCDSFIQRVEKDLAEAREIAKRLKRKDG